MVEVPVPLGGAGEYGTTEVVPLRKLTFSAACEAQRRNAHLFTGLNRLRKNYFNGVVLSSRAFRERRICFFSTADASLRSA
jgi:hypothetical protein